MGKTPSYQSASQVIISGIEEAISALNLEWSKPISVEYPSNQDFGDYASSVALSIFSQLKSENSEATTRWKSPRELAEAIAQHISTVHSDEQGQEELFSKIEVAGPGFINFTLNQQFLFTQAQRLIALRGKLPKESKSAGSIIIEYLSPNTNKPLHIGHLRNGALGLAIGRLMEENGWTVHFAAINNDRGLHIMKSVWSYLVSGRTQQSNSNPAETNWQQALKDWIQSNDQWMKPDDMPQEKLKKPDHFVGYWYTKADKEAENPKVQETWSQMLQTWEQPDKELHAELRQLWQTMNNWFYEGFKQTAAELGITFDPKYVSYESQIFEAGRQIVIDGVEKGIFKKLPDGAVKVELEEKYKLPDKILLRKDGTGIYMTFDIELTRQRSQLDVDKLMWVVGVDQKLYFQQLFAVCEMLGYGQRSDFHHYAYGMVRLPEGKMSSRKGTVVYADDLIEAAQDQAAQVMDATHVAKSFHPQERLKVMRAVGIGAVKWTMLSQDPVSEITFNLEESVSFKGFAGPYIQYTAARCHSVLEKAQNGYIKKPIDTLLNLLIDLNDSLDKEEVDLLRNLIKYFDTVKRAAENMAPHQLCVYLFELSQVFNAFYAACPILSEDEQQQAQMERRLVLTQAVETALNKGLTLLGITPVEKM